ncbi:TPA: hypothetical protein DF272_00035 [Candidatus Falkowbacteria bacterium]|nr:hypothetical protein [Candidatus Falkowbacteria bacterium]
MSRKHRAPPLYTATSPDHKGYLDTHHAAGRVVEFIDEQFSGSDRFEDIPRVQGFVSILREMLAAFGRTKSDHLERLLSNVVSYVIDLGREITRLTEQLAELNRQADNLAAKSVQTESARIARGNADRFIKDICEYLTFCVMECQTLTKEYESHTDHFEQKMSELQEKIEGVIHDLSSEDIDNQIFHVQGLIMAFEKSLPGPRQALTSDQKQSLASRLADIGVQVDHFRVNVENISEILSSIQTHQAQIISLNIGRASELRSKIKLMQDQIAQIKNTFVAGGHEPYFWGLTYGLQDAYQYKPVDLQLYRVELPQGSGLDLVKVQEELTQIVTDFDRVKKVIELVLTETEKKVSSDAAAPVADRAPRPSALPVIIPENDLPPNPFVGDRFDQLSELYLCFLWAFIQRNIKRAQDKMKPVGRGGDWGKAPKLIARVLHQAGAITEAEIPVIVSGVTRRLSESGMIDIRTTKRVDSTSGRIFNLKSARMTTGGRSVAALISQLDMAGECLPLVKAELSDHESSLSRYYRAVMALSIMIDEETKESYQQAQKK